MCTIPQEWEFYTVILITSDNVPTETVCGVNLRVTRSAARPTEDGRTHFPSDLTMLSSLALLKRSFESL